MNEAQRFLLDFKDLLANRQAQAQAYFDPSLGDWGADSIRIIFPDGSTMAGQELAEALDELPELPA